MTQETNTIIISCNNKNNNTIQSRLKELDEKISVFVKNKSGKWKIHNLKIIESKGGYVFFRCLDKIER
jgi:hypothetical protein